MKTSMNFATGFGFIALRSVIFTFLFAGSPLLISCGAQTPAADSTQGLPKQESSKEAERQTRFKSVFVTWDNVFKGRMEPSIDLSRVSGDGMKVIEGLEKSWHRQFQTNGHGMKMQMAPRGIHITIEKARKERLGIKADEPWEKNLSDLSILREGKRLRCWYSTSVPQQKQEYLFQNGRAMETGGVALCYAESTDGFHWDKPKLGIFSFNGSKENNIVSFADFGASVFRDKNGSPDARYKSFEFGKLPAEELAKSRGGDFNSFCLYALVSPDGYHWRSQTNNPLIRHFCDTQNIGAWDSSLKKYVGYFRDHQGGRAISRSETEDFNSWPPPQPLLVNGPEDDPDIDYYSIAYTTYPGKPELRLLFPAIYHQAIDRVNVRFAISQEGRAFNWVSHEPIIDLGKPGEWDSGQIYACPDLIQLPDGRFALPYSGNAGTHNEGFYLGFYTNYPWSPGYGWAIWDEDRLAGIEAKEEGEFYTHPFPIAGEQIEVNARAARAGGIAFELCEEGQPVKGYSLADCIPVESDQLRAPLLWKSKKNVAELKGKKLQLHLVLTHAKIFSYRVITSSAGKKG